MEKMTTNSLTGLSEDKTLIVEYTNLNDRELWSFPDDKAYSRSVWTRFYNYWYLDWPHIAIIIIMTVKSSLGPKLFKSLGQRKFDLFNIISIFKSLGQ